MVKRNVCNKTKFSYVSKNILGVDLVLKIDKRGKSLIVTLEQKIGSSLFNLAVYVLTAVFLLILIHLAFYNVVLTKTSTSVFVALLLYKFVGIVRSETVVMVHSLGYQVTSKYMIGQRDLFIPWNQVQNIFINEVIIRHKVIHLLTILTKDGDHENLIPLFKELQPCLKHLELIFRYIKGFQYANNRQLAKTTYIGLNVT